MSGLYSMKCCIQPRSIVISYHVPGLYAYLYLTIWPITFHRTMGFCLTNAITTVSDSEEIYSMPHIGTNFRRCERSRIWSGERNRQVDLARLTKLDKKQTIEILM